MRILRLGFEDGKFDTGLLSDVTGGPLSMVVRGFHTFFRPCATRRPVTPAARLSNQAADKYGYNKFISYLLR